MLSAIGSLTLLGLILGSALAFASVKLRVESGGMEAEIEEMLPGSQCGQCGYPGCGPAAAAMASGAAPVTICPPGGKVLASELAALLGVEVDLSAVEDKAPAIAFINEDLCVGCTRCFKRCPTDAIVGASKQIHAVVSDACTGCEACVDACPTECITLRPIPESIQTWHWPKPNTAPVPQPVPQEAA